MIIRVISKASGIHTIESPLKKLDRTASQNVSIFSEEMDYVPPDILSPLPREKKLTEGSITNRELSTEQELEEEFKSLPKPR